MMSFDDTIYALATPRGKSGVAVVRISGAHSGSILQQLSGRALPPARQAQLCLLRNTQTGEAIDQALTLWFPGPASFTGEDVVELHPHGGRAVLAAVLDALDCITDLRLAVPGEFTRRAFENGKLDLTQVEGLADLIAAETEAQRKLARQLISGSFSERMRVWRATLARALAYIEAGIDFADEELPKGLSKQAGAKIREISNEIKDELRGARAAERIREGLQVAIIGAPNAGKSMLINAIAGRDVAITSDIPGTTRDAIEAHLDLGGLAVTLIDTAGLRNSEDKIEIIGIAHARERAAAADLRILVRSVDALGEDAAQALRPGDLEVWNKCDITAGSGDMLQISALTKQGLDNLLAELTRRLGVLVQNVGVASRERHRQMLSSALSHLDRALDKLGEWSEIELAAEEIRLAARTIDQLVGKIDVEQVLDRVFAEFCLGK